ncbi:MAG: sigma-70 family RNA polymerase sigma factor [Blastocatellia bacterium]
MNSNITQLLQAWADGDPAALDELTPLVYDELRRLARGYMRNERAGHTLQTTALINEAWLRLAAGPGADFQNRAHFIAIAAQTMRRVLVDFARARQRVKRGAQAEHAAFDEAMLVAPAPEKELIALDDALNTLRDIDPRKTLIVELRYFGGLDVDETAAALNLSRRTILREWQLARAWLYRELRGDDVIGDERENDETGS